MTFRAYFNHFGVPIFLTTIGFFFGGGGLFVGANEIVCPVEGMQCSSRVPCCVEVHLNGEPLGNPFNTLECDPLTFRCVRKTCGEVLGACNSDYPCCDLRNQCFNGACRPRCTAFGGRNCTSVPCCPTLGGFNNLIVQDTTRCISDTCVMCKNNGQSCTATSDCCIPNSQCSNGVCKGCVGLEDTINLCKSNTDCCAGTCDKAPGASEGICVNILVETCSRTGNCLFTPNICCDGYSCRNNDNGGSLPSKTCQRNS